LRSKDIDSASRLITHSHRSIAESVLNLALGLNCEMSKAKQHLLNKLGEDLYLSSHSLNDNVGWETLGRDVLEVANQLIRKQRKRDIWVFILRLGSDSSTQQATLWCQLDLEPTFLQELCVSRCTVVAIHRVERRPDFSAFSDSFPGRPKGTGGLEEGCARSRYPDHRYARLD
jgi:hypothetical protein